MDNGEIKKSLLELIDERDNFSKKIESANKRLENLKKLKEDSESEIKKLYNNYFDLSYGKEFILLEDVIPYINIDGEEHPLMKYSKFSPRLLCEIFSLFSKYNSDFRFEYSIKTMPFAFTGYEDYYYYEEKKNIDNYLGCLNGKEIFSLYNLSMYYIQHRFTYDKKTDDKIFNPRYKFDSSAEFCFDTDDEYLRRILYSLALYRKNHFDVCINEDKMKNDIVKTLKRKR